MNFLVTEYCAPPQRIKNSRNEQEPAIKSIAIDNLTPLFYLTGDGVPLELTFSERVVEVRDCRNFFKISRIEIENYHIIKGVFPLEPLFLNAKVPFERAAEVRRDTSR
jgi:hypothetical protein